MLPCKQTLDYSVSLFGDTLPLYCLYGKVKGQVYTCNPFTGKTGNMWYVSIWDGKKWKPGTDRAISAEIEKFLAHHAIMGDHVIVCQHKKQKKQDAFIRAKRAEAVHNKNIMRDMRDIGMPQERKPSGYDAKTHSQRQIDGKGYNLDYEYKIWIDEKNPNPLPVVDDVRAKADYAFKPFEMGQNTSGSVDGPYTRSGWEVKKEGCITMQDVTKDRQKEADKKNKVSATTKGADFIEIKIRKALRSRSDAMYLERNEPEAFKVYMNVVRLLKGRVTVEQMSDSKAIRIYKNIQK